MPEVLDELTGEWKGTVSHDDEVDEYTVTLSEDGSVSLVTHRSNGTGTWERTGPDTFLLMLKEVFRREVGQHSPNGKAADYIRIDIEARVSEDSFSGGGTAAVYGMDGEVIYSTTAQTTARRIS